MATHGEFDITINKTADGYFAHITRPGSVRHFQHKGSFQRIFAIDLGPFDSTTEAVAVAKAGIDAGWLEP